MDLQQEKNSNLINKHPAAESVTARLWPQRMVLIGCGRCSNAAKWLSRFSYIAPRMLSACYISQWAARDGTPPSFCTACCGSMSVFKDCWERLRTGMFIISGIFKWDDCHFILLLLCEMSDPLRPLKHIMNKRFSLMQLTHKNDVFTSDAVQKLC